MEGRPKRTPFARARSSPALIRLVMIVRSNSGFALRLICSPGIDHPTRYLHPDSDQIARFAWMEKTDALTIARQMTDEGEREVQIEDETGQLWGFEGLAGS